MSIYPNPAKNQLVVKGNKKEFSYQIYDLTGKLQLEGLSNKTIFIENLSKGIYVMKVNEESVIKNFSFIKN